MALEYLRALKGHPELSPLLIQRQGADYHNKDLQAPLPSASALRLAVYNGSLKEAAARLAAPPATAQRLISLKEDELPQTERLYPALQLALLRQSDAELRNIYGIVEGLENRLREAISAPCYEEFVKTAVSRRYPATRLQRLILHLLMKLEKDNVSDFDSQGPLYARLLAAGPRGRAMLKAIKAGSDLPLIAKTAQFLNSRTRVKGLEALSPLQQMLAFDTWATELRYLTLGKNTGMDDFTHSPVFLN